MTRHSSEKLSALVAGATGVVGRQLLSMLLADPAYETVHVLSRRPIATSEDKLQVHEVNFDELDRHVRLFDVDHVFCCLGTTMKQAGSREAFRRVDHDYVVKLAQLALEAGAERFLMVSAVGADTRSLAFYSRVKGETEREVREVGPSTVHIVRPSLLLGAREERRSGEEMAKLLMPLVNPLLAGPLRKYRGVEPGLVAHRLHDLARHGSFGQHVHYCY